MKIEYEKFLNNIELQEVAITRWIKPKGYDLAVCEFANKMFGLNLILSFGSIQESRRLILSKTKYDIGEESPLALYVWHKDNETGVSTRFLLITENDWTAKDYGTICHELHHFAHNALDTIGVTYGSGGEELYAYFQGYFMELIIKAFQELRKAKRLKK